MHQVNVAVLGCQWSSLMATQYFQRYIPSVYVLYFPRLMIFTRVEIHFCEITI
jgi:hypothetical protein